MLALRRSTILILITTGAAMFAAGTGYRLLGPTGSVGDAVFHLPLLFAALVVALGQPALGPVSIILVLGSINAGASYMKLLWITMFSTAASSAVPFPAAIPLRIVLQKRICGVPIAKSASGLVIESVLSYGCAAVVAVVLGGIFLAPVVGEQVVLFDGSALGVFVTAGLLACLVVAFVTVWSKKRGFTEQLQQASRDILNARVAALFGFIGVLLLSYGLTLIRFQLVLRSMEVEMPSGPLLAALAVSYLAGLISFVPMGLGVRDVGLGSLLVLLGCPVSIAVWAAATDRILISLPHLVGGVVATQTLGRDVLEGVERDDENRGRTGVEIDTGS